MIIKFSPQRRDDFLQITKSGETLSINGMVLDFSSVVEGEPLPAEDIACEWIAGAVERVDGQLIVAIIIPLDADASEAARFPVPLENPPDGFIVFPE